jgi:hypothetical protein
MTIETENKAKSFFQATIDIASNLYGRWLDERQYEDINDYQKPLNPIAQRFGIQITKMNKRPFGFNFTVDGFNFTLAVKGNQISFRQV